MRFILLTVITSLITWAVWPWILNFFKYVKSKYDIAKNFDDEEEANNGKITTTKETNDETD